MPTEYRTSISFAWEKLIPVSHSVYAANGTLLEISGCVEIPMKPGNPVLPTSALISPDVAEIMLSHQWMHDNRCVWDFHNHLLCTGEQSAVKSRNLLLYVDVCMLKMLNVVVPPRHQVTVPARSTVDNLRVSSANGWLIEPKQIRPGVVLARTLLPDRHRDIAVRVVNTTNEPHRSGDALAVKHLA